MEPQEIRDVLLDITAESLEAQLMAVRRLQGRTSREPAQKKRMSQIDMVYDVLDRAGHELHINDILVRVEHVHGVRLERESIVSTLTKKVHQRKQFVRTDKNTFAIRKEKE
jgi:hypothetical protein